MELLDIVDEHGNITGMVVEREEAHRRGILHRTSHVWIVGKKMDNSKFFYKNEARKKRFSSWLL